MVLWPLTPWLCPWPYHYQQLCSLRNFDFKHPTPLSQFLLPAQSSALSGGFSTSLNSTVDWFHTFPLFLSTPPLAASPHCPPYSLGFCGPSWPPVHWYIINTLWPLSPYIVLSWKNYDLDSIYTLSTTCVSGQPGMAAGLTLNLAPQPLAGPWGSPALLLISLHHRSPILQDNDFTFSLPSIFLPCHHFQSMALLPNPRR